MVKDYPEIRQVVIQYVDGCATGDVENEKLELILKTVLTARAALTGLLQSSFKCLIFIVSGLC